MPKLNKTLFKKGFSHSLISRVYKAMSKEMIFNFSSNKNIDIIDGRGISHSVDSGIIDVVCSYLDAKDVASTTTAYLRSRLSFDAVGGLMIKQIESKRGRPAKIKEQSETPKISKKKIKRNVT